MSSPSFFTRPTGLSVGEIAALTGASPRQGARLDVVVKGIAAPELARPTDIVFLDNDAHLGGLATTRAAS
jgi:UDP-3-O-[3-hydroxymyristoyl] glucosamine N-acyltransferase